MFTSIANELTLFNSMYKVNIELRDIINCKGKITEASCHGTLETAQVCVHPFKGTLSVFGSSMIFSEECLFGFHNLHPKARGTPHNSPYFSRMP